MADDHPTPSADAVPIGIAVQELLHGRSAGLVALIALLSTPLIAASLLLDGVRHDEPRPTAMSFMTCWGPSLALPGRDDSAAVIAASAALWMVGMVLVALVWATGVKGLQAPLGEPAAWSAAARYAIGRCSTIIVVGLLLGIGTTIAFTLLFVPGVVVSVGWFLAFPVLVHEEGRGLGALRRSWRLVRPRWWWTFGQILMVTLFLALTHAVVVLVPAALLAEGGGTARFAGALVTEVASAVITGVGYIALAVVLFERLRAEEEDRRFEPVSRVTGPPTYEPPAPTTAEVDGHQMVVDLDRDDH